MTEIIPGRERRKAEFIAAYKALCQAFGMMATKIDAPAGEFSPHVVAELVENPTALDAACSEMLIEDLRTVSPHEQ